MKLRIAGLMIASTGLAAAITLALTPSPAKAGDEQYTLHMCAAVYSAVMGNFADPNYLAMVHQYYLYSPYTLEADASNEVTRASLALVKAVYEGKISEDDVFVVMKGCARVHNIPPPEISYNKWPNHAKPPVAQARSSAPVSVAPSKTELACESASNRYRSILQSIPGRLSAAGPRQYKECDRPGPMCNVARNNSKWYYEMGKICSELKPVQNEIRQQCGETIADLDDC